MSEKTLISILSEALVGKKIKIFKVYGMCPVCIIFTITPHPDWKWMKSFEECIATILEVTPQDYIDEGISIRLKIEVENDKTYELSTELTESLIFINE